MRDHRKVLIMSCSKCDKVLSSEEVKAKMICDFCNDVHCLPCSGLSTSETRVTQLAKGRILLFACDGCVATVKASKMNSKNPATNVEAQLNQLKDQLDGSMSSLRDELTKTYTQRIEELQENLTEKLDNFRKQFTVVGSSVNRQQSSMKCSDDLSYGKTEKVPVTAEMVQHAVNDALGSLYSDKLHILTKTSGERASRMVLRGSGKDEQEDFRGEVSKMWIYLGRVTKTSNEAAVRNFIRGKINMSEDDLVVEQLKTVGKSNSFKIGIEPKYFNTLSSPEFWPTNIIFRRFNFRRENMSINGNSASYPASGRNQTNNNNYARNNNSRQHNGSWQNERRRNFPRNYQERNQL